MENKHQPDHMSPEEVRRRAQARGVLSNVLPRSRGQSPARPNVAYGNPDSLPGSAGTSPNPTRRDLGLRNRSESPIFGEGGTLSGEDEFNQMLDSVRSPDTATAKGYSLVQAFSKVSKVSAPPTLTAESTEYTPNLDPATRQSERADDTLSNIDRSRARHGPDFISLFSKPAEQPTTAKPREPLQGIDNAGEERTSDGVRAMGRRRRNRQAGTRARRQQADNSQRAEEGDRAVSNATPGQAKSYYPMYIQPVPDVGRPNAASYGNEYTGYSQRRSSNQGQSTMMNSLTDAPNRRPARKGFVKRHRARPGDNRLSSSTSGESSDEAVDKTPKRISDNLHHEASSIDPSGYSPQRPRVRTRQRRARSSQQQPVPSHTPDYISGNRNRKISQPVASSTKQSDLSGHVTSRHTNGRKQYSGEVVDKYSTLPANFRPSLEQGIAEQTRSTTSDQSKPYVAKQTGKRPDDINQNILPNRHELIIAGEQTSGSLDGTAKARNVAHQSNANQSQTKHSPSNAVLQSNRTSSKVDLHASAPGRKGSIDKAAVQLPLNKSAVGHLRNLFNSTDGAPKTEFGQVYNNSSGKKQSPRTSSSSRKSSISEQPQHDVAEEVFRPRQIEARKVAEHCWPPNEDTKLLLSKNHVNVKSTSDDLALQGRTLSNENPAAENANSMDNGIGVDRGTDFHADVVQETNLNDGDAGYLGLPASTKSHSMPASPVNPVVHTEVLSNKEMITQQPVKSENTKTYAWNFEETDKKLEKFSALDLNGTEQVLKDITESLHDISIGGKQVYKAPSFDMSLPKSIEEVHQEDSVEPTTDVGKCISSRKSSVVSQSTALPRKSSSQPPPMKLDSADIENPSCFAEEDTIPRQSLLDQPTALISSVNGLTNGIDSALKRRRKYSAGTQGTSDTTSISTGADSSRSLSDPMPHGEIPIQEHGKNILEMIESKKVLDNSVSDLSNYSENMIVQDEYSENVRDSGFDQPDFKKAYPGKSGAKVVKKKSFSDPIRNAVETAGKMGKVQSPAADSSAMYTSSSEPNLSEQMDSLGDLNGFKMLHNRGSQVDVMHNQVGYISSPTMTIQGDRKTSDTPDPPQSDSSNRSSLAEKSDGIEHVIDHEEQQFRQVLKSMTSESDKKMPVAHTRSCSEPVDMDNNLNKSSTRVRRPGIIQAPSMNDMTLSNLGSNIMTAKQFSSSVDEIHAATLPRAAGSRGLEYPDMRKHVVKNLLDTEGSYVKSLKILYETYLTPLKRPENHSICEPRHVDVIFFQIPEILQHHQRFYANVRDRYQNWDPKYVKMGDVFIQSFNKDKLFESYTSYIDNYTSARETVNFVTQAKSSFRAFLEQCQRENKEKQRLSDLMIKPVQRIPRYELILKDLVKHTPEDHPDRPSLLLAQQEMHALSVQMNKGEKEAEAADKHDRVLRDIEQLVEGVIEIAGVPKRRFIMQEILVELKSVNKKDRSLWLFNDLLMCTQVKKRAGSSMRRTSMWATGGDRPMIDFTAKYKFLWKFPLEDVELLKGSTSTSRQCAERQLQHLRNDQEILFGIEKLAGEMTSNHVSLDEVVRDLLYQTSQRIAEKQHAASQGLSVPGRMEIGISTPDGMKIFPFEFATDDRKTRFEEHLINARTNTTSQKGRWDPAFLKAIPVSKNRNGMQLSCSAANSESYNGSKEVWVCNTDDYVGEICFLNIIEGDPCQGHCVRVCKSKIFCITHAPAWDHRYVPTSTFLNDFSKGPLAHNPTRRRSSSNSNPALRIMPFDSDDSDEDNTSPFSTRSSCGRSPYGTNNSTLSNYGDSYYPPVHKGTWYLGSSSDEDIQIPVVSPLLPSPYLRRRFDFDQYSRSLPHFDLSTSTDTTIMSEPASGVRGLANHLIPNLLGGGAFKKDSDGSTLHGSLEDLLSDGNSANAGGYGAGALAGIGADLAEAGRTLGGHGSMWMGTEDGTINVYPTSESNGDPKSVAQLHHNASVQCILYHEGQMFVALSNGDLVIYSRNMTTGHWSFENKKTISLGAPPNQITKMIVVGEKDLWCGCQNQVMIIDMKTNNLKSFFAVSQDCKRQIHCMVCCGYGVWVALDKRAQIKLYHTVTHDLITDIDVTQPVAKMLASSDAIIRQHKAACLRITSLLVCKDLLWVGTSAGVVLTLALPSIAAGTSSLTLPIIPQGLAYGHTGHARFLMAIEVVEKEMTPPARGYRRPSLPKRRASSTSNNSQVRTSTLVISGGDGYEDFRMNSASEAAGNGDSTNHMLVWKV